MSFPAGRSSDTHVLEQHRVDRDSARTIPAWVRPARDEDIVDPTNPLLPPGPARAAPVSRWHHFMASSAPPRSAGEAGQILSQEQFEREFGRLDYSWHSEEPTRAPRLWEHGGVKHVAGWTIRSPWAPLLLRLMNIILHVTALAIAVSISRMAQHGTDETTCTGGPSANMAISVSAVAIAYTLAMLYDEYTAKPIGLRSASAKVTLLCLDGFFVAFTGANLAIAFEALEDDRWACWESVDSGAVCPKNGSLCAHQKGLVAVLFLASVAWLATLYLSILRVVRRVAESFKEGHSPNYGKRVQAILGVIFGVPAGLLRVSDTLWRWLQRMVHWLADPHWLSCDWSDGVASQ